MAYVPACLHYALNDDEITHRIGEIDYIFKRRKLADLILPTGNVIACDPLVCPDTDSFLRRAPAGTFPLYVSIAHVRTDQRVGFACLQFSALPVIKWEMALRSGQDVGKLAADAYFGYPVDAGIGCFMDVKAAQGLEKRMKEKNDYYDDIIIELDKTSVNTWSWADITMSDNPNANLVIFSSGWGDGMYASYFGLDSAGEPVCLVTDFGLISEPPTEVSA